MDCRRARGLLSCSTTIVRSFNHINDAACSKRCSPSKNHSPARGLDGREDRFVDHIRHCFDLRRCTEAWVPSTCSINVPHGLPDPCWKWPELHRGERRRWLNGHNGHFSCQPGRDHVCQLPGGYGSGFNGPRAVLKILPSSAGSAGSAEPGCSRCR